MSHSWFGRNHGEKARCSSVTRKSRSTNPIHHYVTLHPGFGQPDESSVSNDDCRLDRFDCSLFALDHLLEGSGFRV